MEMLVTIGRLDLHTFKDLHKKHLKTTVAVVVLFLPHDLINHNILTGEEVFLLYGEHTKNVHWAFSQR
jgi:hypothetical protein